MVEKQEVEGGGERAGAHAYEIDEVTSFSIVVFAHWYEEPMSGHHGLASTLVPPALVTVSCLYAAVEIDSFRVLRYATRGDATPAWSSAVTISSITSKRDLVRVRVRVQPRLTLTLTLTHP